MRIPACIFGCNVFTLPLRISLEPVKSETSIHLNFSFFISLKVPPELIILILLSLRIFKRGFKFDLSDTEIIIVSKAIEREISPSDSELQALLQVGRPRLSQIYNGLNKAGILSVRKKGRSRFFRISESAKSYF
mgnify:CR=1 FL=1